MNQNPTPSPHSFKVIHVPSGQILDNDEFFIDAHGALYHWNGTTYTPNVFIRPASPSEFKAVFPHEERALQFAPREGESFVDRCNRLFPVDSEVWVLDDGWVIRQVSKPFLPFENENDRCLLIYHSQFNTWGAAQISFNEADIEFNAKNPIP